VAFLGPNGLSRRRLATIAAAGMLGRCATVPDVDGLTGDDVGLPDRQKQANPNLIDDSDALQQQYDLQRGLSASPIVFGNEVILLSSGTEAFQAIFKALAAARDSINLEYFILADVQSEGVHLSEVLRDRLQAGVKVNIIYDSYGSRETPGAFFDAMRKAGAKVVEFNPVSPFSVRIGWSPNDRDHRLYRRCQPGHCL
jgi:cardiolipin synthase